MKGIGMDALWYLGGISVCLAYGLLMLRKMREDRRLRRRAEIARALQVFTGSLTSMQRSMSLLGGAARDATKALEAFAAQFRG